LSVRDGLCPPMKEFSIFGNDLAEIYGWAFLSTGGC
jgi:hypothetical protein